MLAAFFHVYLVHFCWSAVCDCCRPLDWLNCFSVLIVLFELEMNCCRWFEIRTPDCDFVADEFTPPSGLACGLAEAAL